MGTNSGNEGCLLPWLDKKLVVEALLNAEPEENVSNVRIASIEKVDGGYLSETFRVIAESDCGRNSRTTSLIVKAAPYAEGQMLALLETGASDKEAAAYCHFLPRVNSALRKVEGQNWKPLAPKLYLHGTQPTSFFALEDLVASGFHKFASDTNLDFEHCQPIIQNSARMHAASLLVLDDKWYSKENFKESIAFNESSLSYIEIYRKYYRNLASILEKYSKFKKYTDKLEKNLGDLFVALVKVVKDCQVNFKVILHGDLHKNNMMFRRRDAAVQACFYDFQGLHIGSPAEDLLYFLYSSASVEVLRDHVEQLLSEYHRTLQDTLRGLGLVQQADAYPLEQLHKDMDHFRLVAVFTALHIMPLMLAPNTVDMPTDPTADDYEEKVEIYLEHYCKNEKFLQHMEHLIPAFDAKGLLEQNIV